MNSIVDKACQNNSKNVIDDVFKHKLAKIFRQRTEKKVIRSFLQEILDEHKFSQALIIDSKAIEDNMFTTVIKSLTSSIVLESTQGIVFIDMVFKDIFTNVLTEMTLETAYQGWNKAHFEKETRIFATEIMRDVVDSETQWRTEGLFAAVWDMQLLSDEGMSIETNVMQDLILDVFSEAQSDLQSQNNQASNDVFDQAIKHILKQQTNEIMSEHLAFTLVKDRLISASVTNGLESILNEALDEIENIESNVEESRNELVEDCLITELLALTRECIASEFDEEELCQNIADEVVLSVVIQQLDQQVVPEVFTDLYQYTNGIDSSVKQIGKSVQDGLAREIVNECVIEVQQSMIFNSFYPKQLHEVVAQIASDSISEAKYEKRQNSLIIANSSKATFQDLMDEQTIRMLQICIQEVGLDADCNKVVNKLENNEIAKLIYSCIDQEIENEIFDNLYTLIDFQVVDLVEECLKEAGAIESDMSGDISEQPSQYGSHAESASQIDLSEIIAVSRNPDPVIKQGSASNRYTPVEVSDSFYTCQAPSQYSRQMKGAPSSQLPSQILGDSSSVFRTANHGEEIPRASMQNLMLSPSQRAESEGRFEDEGIDLIEEISVTIRQPRTSELEEDKKTEESVETYEDLSDEDQDDDISNLNLSLVVPQINFQSHQITHKLKDLNDKHASLSYDMRRPESIISSPHFDEPDNNVDEHHHTQESKNLRDISTKKSMSFLDQKFRLVHERQMLPLDQGFSEVMCQICLMCLPYEATTTHSCHARQSTTATNVGAALSLPLVHKYLDQVGRALRYRTLQLQESGSQMVAISQQMIEMLVKLDNGSQESKREMQESVYILKDILESELNSDQEPALREYGKRILSYARMKFDLLKIKYPDIDNIQSPSKGNSSNAVQVYNSTHRTLQTQSPFQLTQMDTKSEELNKIVSSIGPPPAGQRPPRPLLLENHESHQSSIQSRQSLQSQSDGKRRALFMNMIDSYLSAHPGKKLVDKERVWQKAVVRGVKYQEWDKFINNEGKLW